MHRVVGGVVHFAHRGLAWPESWVEVNITVKQLVLIVLSVALWGKSWTGGDGDVSVR